MSKVKIWIEAARLRTLPLSVAGILAGTGMAASRGVHDPVLFGLLLATTLAYQITSNFANDYGDGVKGTDNAKRIGPQRALQQGALSAAALKRGIVVVSVLSAVLTLLTLFRAFGLGYWHYLLVFCGLGAFAIWSAIKYTVGNSAYGYRGLGDVFVFLFFGLLSVLGTYFVFTRQLDAEIWLPAIAIGALSTAVLNLNNLRDWESDRESGKRTLVVLMGYANGRRYQVLLCLLAFVSMAIYVMSGPASGLMALSLLPFLIVGKHVMGLKNRPNPADLDPELKKIALSTFFIGFILFILETYIL